MARSMSRTLFSSAAVIGRGGTLEASTEAAVVSDGATVALEPVPVESGAAGFAPAGGGCCCAWSEITPSWARAKTKIRFRLFISFAYFKGSAQATAMSRRFVHKGKIGARDTVLRLNFNQKQDPALNTRAADSVSANFAP
jgi:hypothetical protein